MRNTDDGWFDQRLVELIAVVAVTVLIGAGLHYLNAPPKLSAQASFIVPSQTVRW